MRVCFVQEGTVQAFRDGRCGVDERQASLIVFGFNGIGEVSYQSELRGDSRYFEETALLSKTENAVVISGCVTDTCGHKRKSAVIAERGRLLGVSDLLHVTDGACGAGASLRVYETGVGKIGIAVAEDIHFPETIKTLALCGCDFIVCPYGSMKNTIDMVLLRANAYYYGTPLLFCGVGYAMVAMPNGEIAFASPYAPSIFDLELHKEYHLIETRHRGCFTTEI